MRFPVLLLTSTVLLPVGVSSAMAQCAPTAISPGATVNCGSGTFNGTLGTYGPLHQGNIDGVNVNVTPTGAADAVVNGGNDSAIIFRNGLPSTINIGTPGNTTNTSGPLGIATGSINTGVNPVAPIIDPGNNTLQVGSNYVINVWANGRVIQLGDVNNAEAINPLGDNNRITNYGLIESAQGGGSAIWFQNDVLGAPNVIENYGTISVGVDTGRSVIGSTTAGDVRFINQTGAIVRGDISFSSGNDSLVFFPNSTVTGNIDGGGGTNSLELNGVSGSFDTLPGALNNFTLLTKLGEGQWTVSGPLTGFTTVRVENGTLGLTGDNTGYTGTVLVDPAGILEARAQSLPTSSSNLENVTNNGIVRFAQPDTGTYVGQITGTGAVEKTGAGVTTLAPEAAAGNTYLGGTTILEGGLAIAADSALGGPSGPLTLNGGFLQLNADLDLASTRAVTLGPNGGAIDTQAFTSTLSQGMTGPGAFTKLGTGTLRLAGENAHFGTTTVAAGTLQALAANTFSPNSLHVVQAGGTLDLNGFDQSIPGLTNAGLVSTGGAGSTILRVLGPYVGQGGTLQLNTVLASDGAPSDRLLIDGGAATGSTALRIINAGGTGGLTFNDGILVVQAAYGGTTTADAFALAGPVAAGPYNYILGRGGVSTGSGENWYLRNTLEPAPEPTPTPTPTPTPVPPIPVPAPAPEPTPPPAPEVDRTPLYRAEVATYKAMLGTEFIIGRAMVGTFHQRRGDQYLRNEAGVAHGAWGRFFGQSTDQRWTGTVSPEFNGDIFGFQGGLDLFSYENSSGRGSLGVFVAYAKSAGDVRGFADAVQRNEVGRLNLENAGFGATWTHVGPTGWYLDTLVMGQLLSGKATSSRAVGVKADGSGFALSAEAGYPLAIQPRLILEPQAQFIWQRFEHDASRDAFSRLDIGTQSLATGRLGARLQGDFVNGGVEWRPYLLANLWHNFSETSTIKFEDIPISTKLGGTSIEVGGGVVTPLSANVGVFAQASYTDGIGGADERTIQGKIGVHVTW